MKIKALAPWFGSKRNLAPEIVRELGPHRGYCEPFCGSMAVLLSKPPSSMEIANDLHGDLVNLARVLASEHWYVLHERVRRTLMASEFHIEAKGHCAEMGPVAPSIEMVSQQHVERAYWYLVYSWQGRNGVSGTSGTNHHLARRYTIGGGHGPTRWRGVVQSMPEWAERLRSVTIEQMDAFTLLERLEDKPWWSIYIDPPYFQKGSKYAHDFKPEEHGRLSELAARFERARVVVSYYDHERLIDLYPRSRWTHRKFEVNKASAHSGARGRNQVTAVEVLLINGPSYAGGEGGALFESQETTACA